MNITITEDLKQLRDLKRRANAKAQYQRILMLILLKQTPTLTQKVLADELGISDRQVRRWQKLYREGGIERLLDDSAVNLLQMSHHSKGELASNGSVSLRQFVRFVNMLPTRGNLQQMSEGLRDALQGLLHDVDRVTVATNWRCDLHAPDIYRPEIMVFQYGLSGRGHLSATSLPDPTSPVAELINGLQRTGFPVGRYHPPTDFIYTFGSGALLGIILFWRDCDQQPVSLETIEFMGSICEFMTYVLSDIVARHAYGSPVDTAYQDALEKLVVQSGLSSPERRVLIYLLRGVGYEGTAEALHLSVNTVKSHTRSIYLKTGTRNLTELFGSYFTPHLTPKEPAEKPNQK